MKINDVLTNLEKLINKNAKKKSHNSKQKPYAQAHCTMTVWSQHLNPHLS